MWLISVYTCRNSPESKTYMPRWLLLNREFDRIATGQKFDKQGGEAASPEHGAAVRAGKMVRAARARAAV